MWEFFFHHRRLYLGDGAVQVLHTSNTLVVHFERVVHVGLTWLFVFFGVLFDQSLVRLEQVVEHGTSVEVHGLGDVVEHVHIDLDEVFHGLIFFDQNTDGCHVFGDLDDELVQGIDLLDQFRGELDLAFFTQSLGDFYSRVDRREGFDQLEQLQRHLLVVGQFVTFLFVLDQVLVLASSGENTLGSQFVLQAAIGQLAYGGLLASLTGFGALLLFGCHCLIFSAHECYVPYRHVRGVYMLINAEEAILLAEGEDLAAGLIGGPWLLFKQSIPEAQAKILVNAFNLILLTDDTQEEAGEIDEDSVMGRNGSLLPVHVQNLLVDDAVALPNKKAHIYEFMIDNTMSLLQGIGITLNELEVTAEKLPYICKIGYFFYEMQGYQDLIGLAGMLDSFDIPPVDRFLLIMERYLGEGTDMMPYEILLKDVSEVTIRAIKDGLEGEDPSVSIPEPLIKRVKANLPALEGTLAYMHIRSNGQLGGALEGFLNFFHKELAALQENLTGENVLHYLKELIGFYLISEVNSHAIKEHLHKAVYDMVDDMVVLNKAEAMINKLVLTND